MEKLLKYIRPHFWYISVTLAIKFAATYSELGIPSLMETMLDDKVPAGQMS